MTRLLLAFWASLVSVELARGLVNRMPAGNLSCFQCFKVYRLNRCQPKVCQPDEKVCHSNEVLLYTNSRRRRQISKHCAVHCPNSNSEFEWTITEGIRAKIIRRCCSEYLCNRAPDTQERFRALPGRMLLPMSLGLFGTLL
ncbi:lymphocyte antigen 6L [Onychomys torridus]|uniref:lymphocyte antigen 6L n=1 Tax=Onychomys torridus TaxID=38674 RepID=UPI00167F788F|nr:lymphocyte antigen 6L [Onychomys torridus]